MTAPRLSALYRHPLKAIGREALDRVTLAPGAWMPWDRVWAVAHARAKPLDGDWMHGINFLRGVTHPGLMAVTARFDDTERQLSLSHPNAGDVSFRPDIEDDEPRFLEWAARVWPDDLPAPTGIYRTETAHLTDMPEPWLSINSTSSLDALSQMNGAPLSPHRWRGNLWIDGMTPWSEFDLIGRKIRIGDVSLKVEVAITRCKATMANPETGLRDTDTLGLLQSLGHQEFGVYASVLDGGEIAVGDNVSFAP